jgi:hypothetical protein
MVKPITINRIPCKIGKNIPSTPRMINIHPRIFWATPIKNRLVIFILLVLSG